MDEGGGPILARMDQSNRSRMEANVSTQTRKPRHSDWPSLAVGLIGALQAPSPRIRWGGLPHAPTVTRRVD